MVQRLTMWTGRLLLKAAYTIAIWLTVFLYHLVTLKENPYLCIIPLYRNYSFSISLLYPCNTFSGIPTSMCSMLLEANKCCFQLFNQC